MVCLIILIIHSGYFLASGQDQLKKLQMTDIAYLSGIGWGIPIGKTNEVLSPKYSGSLGLVATLKNKKYFLYPTLDFLSFKYDQKLEDKRYTHLIEKGKSNFYTLNLSGGIKTTFENWNFYAFAGPGLVLVSEQRALAISNETVRLKEAYTLSPALKIGGGVDYRIGNVALFVELSALHNFRKIQERPTNNILLFGGVKTNITKLADKVVEVITEQKI